MVRRQRPTRVGRIERLLSPSFGELKKDEFSTVSPSRRRNREVEKKDKENSDFTEQLRPAPDGWFSLLLGIHPQARVEFKRFSRISWSET
jgi:hypothetical protein